MPVTKIDNSSQIPKTQHWHLDDAQQFIRQCSQEIRSISVKRILKKLTLKGEMF